MSKMLEIVFKSFQISHFSRPRPPKQKRPCQLTNCTKKGKKNNALPCLKYHDLHGKRPFADPYNKDNVNKKMV